MRETILIVDDQPSMCWILTKILSQEGYLVKTAVTASAALAIVENDEVHAAIVDYRLPDMNGIELFQRLVKKHPRIPAVLITSYGSPELRDAALKAGMLAYFDKPLDMRKFVVELAEILDSRTNRQHHRKGN